MNRFISLALAFFPLAITIHAQESKTIRELMEEIQSEYGVHFVYDSNLDVNEICMEKLSKNESLTDRLNYIFTYNGIIWKKKGRNITLKNKRSKNKYKQTKEDRPTSKSYNLNEIIVSGNVNSPLLHTQTGKVSLMGKDFANSISLLSSPDVVKTLQRISGVSSGVELTSGLYVHGGGGDENLFILDDTPIYQTSHSLGLFSAFNTDIIKSVDFYKSGFPARYNGRLSSITDVRTRNGDTIHTHGSFSIGLLDGRFYVEGPIVKSKTSFIFGLRRSWMDLFLKPAFAIMNSSDDDGEKYSLGYAFYDLNGKITHKFSERSEAYISLYSSKDNYNIQDKSVWARYTTDTKNDFVWGNTNLTLNWKYGLNKKTAISLSAIFTKNSSEHKYAEDDTERDENIVKRTSLDNQKNMSNIYDIGGKIDFKCSANTKNRILCGGSYIYHIFKPQTLCQTYYYNDNSENSDSTKTEGHNYSYSNEMTLYVEDEWRICNRWMADFGMSYSMFCIKDKVYSRLDPRLALKYQVNENISLKMSYSKMSQYIHRIAGTYLEMPTDFWIPTTKDISPMKSAQLAAGFYTKISSCLLVMVEGFYKKTNNIIQYRNWMGLLPPASSWDKNVISGKAKSYGIDIDVKCETPTFTISAAYTLSWSCRKFDDFYSRWFRDKFDNRHKIDIVGRYKLGAHTSMYAAWTYHSGNRISLPTQYVNTPTLPEDVTSDNEYFYEEPNNIGLPAYHRLDIGFNFHSMTRKKHERIWNISLYNAYCHLNPMYVNVRRNDNGNFQARCKGYIPIIPSVSYTIKF